MKHADHWFYVPVSSTGSVAFPQEEAIHAAKVLRLQKGDGIQWLNGKGCRFTGRIVSINKTSLEAEVLSKTVEIQASSTVLAVGRLHDANRLEWLVEKATELGVSEILLVSTTRVERTRYKMARLNAKVVSAVKQSGRAWVPTLKEMNFVEALQYCQTMDTRYIAHCYADQPRIANWITEDSQKSACLFIGPEGDFTVEEVQQAERVGFLSISLGNARLRTETAAIASLVKLRNLLI